MAAFHFLRPAVLLLLIPEIILIMWARRHQSPERAWRRIVAPHLLKYLMVNKERKKGLWQPLHALVLLWLLGTFALAGPAWKRKPAPFSEEKAALVLVVRVSPSMLAGDLQPSRLKWAANKISDLLKLRSGARTALIVYSGSAHLAMPLTRDAKIIEMYAAELTPKIMPVTGNAAAEAVALANERLRKAKVSGTIVLLADAISADQFKGLKAQHDKGGAPVIVMAMATGPEVVPPPGSPSAPVLDQVSMKRAAEAAGGTLVLPSADNSDVKRVAWRAEHSLAAVNEQKGQQWEDAGYFLLPFIALFVLLGFRRGWVVHVQ